MVNYKPFPPMLPGESVMVDAAHAARINRTIDGMVREIERLKLAEADRTASGFISKVVGHAPGAATAIPLPRNQQVSTPMKIRAKFQLQEHRQSSWGGEHRQHTFIFRPSYDPSIPEDQRFSQASPSGEMSITVDNPPVVAYWAAQVGKQFYLDFTPASDDVAS